MRFIENNMEEAVDAYWGNRGHWESLPDDINDFKPFTDWAMVVPIDHGYDESKPESELTLADMQKAAEFRGGKCLSETMEKGDWTGKLRFQCAFGHTFEASPRLVLEGGHWCPQCERESWNYAARAKVDPLVAQVWTPLHTAAAPARRQLTSRSRQARASSAGPSAAQAASSGGPPGARASAQQA